MTRSTEAHVRIAVEQAIERLLDRWATGDTKAQTEKYLHKLHLPRRTCGVRLMLSMS